MFSETGYFLRLSIRYFSKKQLHFTLVNIIGLAVGFACFLSAVLFSYDDKFCYVPVGIKIKKVLRVWTVWRFYAKKTAFKGMFLKILS